jgi:hypothetical protein
MENAIPPPAAEMLQLPTKRTLRALALPYDTRHLLRPVEITWLVRDKLSRRKLARVFGSRSPIKIREFLNMARRKHRQPVQEPACRPAGSPVRSSRIGD